MNYVVKYKLHFHTFNKEVDGTVSVENGLSFFDGERNCAVYNESDAVHYIKSIHKQGDIEKLFDTMDINLKDALVSYNNDYDPRVGIVKAVTAMNKLQEVINKKIDTLVENKIIDRDDF